METKVCERCKRELELNKFKKTRWGTYSKICTECVVERLRGTKWEQQEKIKELQKRKDAERVQVHSKLAEFTPRQLIEELARRGYKGKLTYTEVHEIDITNF